jgi:hypothetical protein
VLTAWHSAAWECLSLCTRVVVVVVVVVLFRLLLS